MRAKAAELRLSVAEKAESMELCFAGEQDYRLALENNATNRPGDMTDMQGRKIGVHKGIANYTLGQRRGLGFAGGQPLYVGRIDAVANTVALGTREEVSTRVVRAACRNTLLPERLTRTRGCSERSAPMATRDPAGSSDLTPDGMTVEFDEAQFAPCPGQRLVLYDEQENVVAGGVFQVRSDAVRRFFMPLRAHYKHDPPPSLLDVLGRDFLQLLASCQNLVVGHGDGLAHPLHCPPDRLRRRPVHHRVQIVVPAGDRPALVGVADFLETGEHRPHLRDAVRLNLPNHHRTFAQPHLEMVHDGPDPPQFALPLPCFESGQKLVGGDAYLACHARVPGRHTECGYWASRPAERPRSYVLCH